MVIYGCVTVSIQRQPKTINRPKPYCTLRSKSDRRPPCRLSLACASRSTGKAQCWCRGPRSTGETSGRDGFSTSRECPASCQAPEKFADAVLDPCLISHKTFVAQLLQGFSGATARVRGVIHDLSCRGRADDSQRKQDFSAASLYFSDLPAKMNPLAVVDRRLWSFGSGDLVQRC